MTTNSASHQRFFYAIIWILMLVFLVWPLAGFVSWFWICLLPFEAVHPLVRDVTSFLEKFMTWPREMGNAIVEGRSTFPRPDGASSQ